MYAAASRIHPAYIIYIDIRSASAFFLRCIMYIQHIVKWFLMPAAVRRSLCCGKVENFASSMRNVVPRERERERSLMFLLGADVSNIIYCIMCLFSIVCVGRCVIRFRFEISVRAYAFFVCKIIYGYAELNLCQCRKTNAIKSGAGSVERTLRTGRFNSLRAVAEPGPLLCASQPACSAVVIMT